MNTERLIEFQQALEEDLLQCSGRDSWGHEFKPHIGIEITEKIPIYLYIHKHVPWEIGILRWGEQYA